MNANVDESNRVYTFNVTDFISHKWYIVNISHRQIWQLILRSSQGICFAQWLLCK